MTHPIDELVGRRIKSARWTAGLSQEELAVKIGTSFQQLQKYESGKNRISASRLFDLAHALSLPVSYFFNQETHNHPTMDKATATLVKNFSSLSPDKKRLVSKLAKDL